MRVTYVFWNQNVLFVSDLWIFGYHLYSSSTGLIRWLHDPELVFVGSFSCHLKPVIVWREEICVWDEIIGLWEASPLFVQVFPHIIFASKLPTSWKVVDFLELIHSLKLLDIASCDIEVNIPLISVIQLQKAIVFKRIYNAFVLWATNFVKKLDFL